MSKYIIISLSIACFALLSISTILDAKLEQTKQELYYCKANTKLLQDSLGEQNKAITDLQISTQGYKDNLEKHNAQLEKRFSTITLRESQTCEDRIHNVDILLNEIYKDLGRGDK